MALSTTLKKPAKGAPPATPDDVLAKTVSESVNKDAKTARTAVSPMNFSVSLEFRKEFKETAARHNKSMSTVLKEAFELWKKENDRE